jgi:hypothetical protein
MGGSVFVAPKFVCNKWFNQFPKALISRKSNFSNWNFAKEFGRKVMWFSIM